MFKQPVLLRYSVAFKQKVVGRDRVWEIDEASEAYQVM